MLQEFRPGRRSVHPEYPFWRLQNGGVWQVTADEPLRMRVSNTDPLKSELLEHHARGAFSEPVAQAFDADPSLVGEVAARVLSAYEDRCTVCDVDLRMGSKTVGLDAAHIRWHQAGGPDDERNGLALCTLHHKVFDLGAFTLRPEDRTVLVSDEVRGSLRLEEVLLRHHGSPIRVPQRPEFAPDPEHLAWHYAQVFKGRARPVA